MAFWYSASASENCFWSRWRFPSLRCASARAELRHAGRTAMVTARSRATRLVALAKLTTLRKDGIMLFSEIPRKTNSSAVILLYWKGAQDIPETADVGVQES